MKFLFFILTFVICFFCGWRAISCDEIETSQENYPVPDQKYESLKIWSNPEYEEYESDESESMF